MFDVHTLVNHATATSHDTAAMFTGGEWSAEMTATGQLWERVSDDCRDAVAGQTEQLDWRQSTEGVPLDAVYVVVVEQYDWQVADAAERIRRHDRQLVQPHIKHLRIPRHIIHRLFAAKQQQYDKQSGAHKQ